jgi:transposase-like protein
MNQTPVKVRRKFDATFKREGLQNWLNSGKSAAVIAGELGLKANRLYAWKQTFAPAAAGGKAAGAKPASLAELQTQLAAARRAIVRISAQRDMLKKRWAFSPNRRRTPCTD